MCGDRGFDRCTINRSNVGAQRWSTAIFESYGRSRLEPRAADSQKFDVIFINPLFIRIGYFTYLTKAVTVVLKL